MQQQILKNLYWTHPLSNMHKIRNMSLKSISVPDILEQCIVECHIHGLIGGNIPIEQRKFYANGFTLAKMRYNINNKSHYYNNYHIGKLILTGENNMINKFEIQNFVEAQVKEYIVRKIKNRLGVVLDLTFTDQQYMKFLSWLKKYDKEFKHHVSSKKVGSKNIYYLNDVDFIVNIRNRTFARIMTQTAIKNSLSQYDIFVGKEISPSTIKMYIFGKEAFKIAKFLQKIQYEYNDIGCYKITSSKYSGAAPNIYYDTLIGRTQESVFLNDNIKEKMINHINKFFENKDIYEKRNLNHKTGILLYGDPGTGKSTIANMIATTFNCDMILINMSEFAYLDIDHITSTINADDNTYVVVLEDIDCVIGDRESDEDDLENKKNVNKLLQFLDSTSSPSNVIFVATTNHIEKLDDAIKRDGRFDLILNITDINRDTAIEMCKSFGITDNKIIIDIIDNNLMDGKINPSKLQNLILQKLEPLNN